jgi:hypothetical protein
MPVDRAWAGVGAPSGMVDQRASGGHGLTIFGEWPTNIASGTNLTCAPLPLNTIGITVFRGKIAEAKKLVEDSTRNLAF